MIEIEHLSPLPPGNPLAHDLYSCGHAISSNVTVITKDLNSSRRADFLIICNHDTGERTAVYLTEEGKAEVQKHLAVSSLHFLAEAQRS